VSTTFKQSKPNEHGEANVNFENKFKIVRPSSTYEFSIKQDGNSTFDCKIDVP
jgi:hypothetical protein